MYVKPIECSDGTLILSKDEEVNEHQKSGWELIEIGMIIFNSTPSAYAPIEFGFRLRRKSSSFCNCEWRNILSQDNNMYRFESPTSITEDIIEVKVVCESHERESLKNAGWILLKESTKIVEGNSHQYAFGLPRI